jgi:hypothetical protein
MSIKQVADLMGHASTTTTEAYVSTLKANASYLRDSAAEALQRTRQMADRRQPVEEKVPSTGVALPLTLLIPLIQKELASGNPGGRRVGEMLLEAKSQIPGGSWGYWLRKQFQLTQRTAADYMRLARIGAAGRGGKAVPHAQ